MPELQINGKSVAVDGEGFLVDPNAWDRDVAAVMAQKEGLELNDGHWTVIDFCRKDWAENGAAPGLRRITKVGGVPTKQIYKLFPGGPGKLAAKIAGLSKPQSCV